MKIINHFLGMDLEEVQEERSNCTAHTFGVDQNSFSINSETALG